MIQLSKVVYFIAQMNPMMKGASPKCKILKISPLKA